MSDPRLRVLVVDDDPNLRLLVAKIMERLDANVDLASDGAEALEKLNVDDRYGVVLLDLMMPRTSGFEVLDQIRRHPPRGLKGVIVMSAIGRPIRASDREIVCAVVEKPFDLAEIRSAVEDCLAAGEQ